MATGAPVTYQVTGVTADTQYNIANTPITGKQVTFEVSNGYLGRIFVPDTVFSDTAAVKAMIEGEVRVVAAAQALNGTVT